MSVQEAVRTTKSERLELRLSAQELELLKQRSAALGLSVSEFVRRAALGSIELPSVPMARAPERTTARAPERTVARAPEPGIPDIPTAVWLSGRSGLPVAACRRAIERGTWRELLP